MTGRAKAPRSRKNDPERTRRDILDVALREFATNGLSGARIDELAARTRTSKRMIYYYFGSKEGLYLAVLEDAYRRIRADEGTLDLGHQPPLDALAALVRFTFDYENANTDFIRVVMVENIHRGKYIAGSESIRRLNSAAIAALRDICERGIVAGVMRADVDPIDLHMSISALCFFNVSNRYTFGTIFGRDMAGREALARRREIVTETILRYVAPEGWCA
ncbi:MAG: TetR family transcriptional regulator [Alphaproteobacteria bacterium]|nr:TetR family transcriptional regulator [Alphaproteobacteria bacterium]